MAANAQFSQLFDEWDHDTDISMIDLDVSDVTNSYTTLQYLHEDNRSRRGSDSISSSTRRQTLPGEDVSARSLLRRSSHATTNDFETIIEVKADIEEGYRQRNGFRSNIHNLLHKKSVATQRTTSTFDGHFAHGKPGWWKKQMLVDRSLRSMAGFTALCALIMFIIVLSYLKDFVNRLNHHSTSVGGKDGESCQTAESRNLAVHLFINIAATMILGCSNTYQQLATALKVGEIRWVLSKRGDSKVGTNSPWAINHKREGKTRAWLAWILLISTSVPVHFLANSVIGPSFYIRMPTTITYIPSNFATDSYSRYSARTTAYTDEFDSGCWTAFRASHYVLPENMRHVDRNYNSNVLGNSTTFANVQVQYALQCSRYANTTNYSSALKEVNTTSHYETQYTVGNCTLGRDVFCLLQDPQARQCRMNVRMQAALILAGCLFIKAAYMITLNYRARFRTKDHCLTFGDVILASVLDPDLKIKNECLLNSGDGYRSKVEHTCHGHCRDPIPSMNGDSIGHCQKCKKFNKIDMAADLPHPNIAIKYKRSLLSNLGSTAVTQMLILMFTSVAMLAISIVMIVGMAGAVQYYNDICGDRTGTNLSRLCDVSRSSYLKDSFGTWGGFSSSATLTSLSPDSLGSEFIAFAVSNGAQFLYSLLYLLLIYNLTLISMEHEWGKWETKRKKPRCTIVQGRPFEQSYFLQLPARLLVPLMFYAALMHWLLGQAISTTETIYTDPEYGIEHSVYFVTYAAYPIFMSTVLMVAMTVVCWWAFTFTREGFIPQMYGSIRTCCSSTTELTDFNPEGILWGDLGMGEQFRHAGFSSDEPAQIVPAELYSGRE